MLNNHSILITGGTGSLGKMLVKIIIEKYQPRRLVILSRDEFKQFEMEQMFPIKKYKFIRYFLGDIRDKERLITAFRNIDYVIHTAALKQVPAAEYNPFEFIKTNIIGAQNIIEAAMFNNVMKVIALSTDKAANPVNLYGATKLCSDKLFLAANAYAAVHCKFSVVRYGNVFGSRGSVIELFLKQKQTGEVILTDERMTRFWITLEQAANFVLKCLDIMCGNELFIPKIPSMRVIDLIKVICPECKIKKIGIRPGEKINEMLISNDEARYCYEFDDYYILKQPTLYLSNEELPEKNGKLVDENFEYKSNTNKMWLTEEEIKKIVDDYISEKYF